MRWVIKRGLLPRSLPHDVLAIGWLWLVVFLLFLVRVPFLTVSHDGIVVLYARFTGNFRVFDIFDAFAIKQAGRPFLGLGWEIACWFGGVDATTTLQFLFYGASATLFYLTVRMLVPHLPVLALTAAAIKLLWHNVELFDNSGLAIYFAETAFWVACALLAFMVTRRISAPLLWMPVAVMAACLIFTVGIYQTPWPLILMVPVALLAFRHPAARPGLPFAAWYLAAVPMMAWCTALVLDSEHDLVQATPDRVPGRALLGLWMATGRAITSPFLASESPLPATPTDPWLVAAVAAFAVLWVSMAGESRAALRCVPGGLLARRSLLMVLAGIGASLVVLVPPSLVYDPVPGSRTLAWAYPALVSMVLAVTVALLAWLRRPLGAVVAGALVVALVWGMASQMHELGAWFEIASIGHRRYWQDAIVLLPGLEEGTVVLMDGPPVLVAAMNDVFNSFTLRAVTGTDSTFLLTDGRPVWDAAAGAYRVTSKADLTGETNSVGRRKHPGVYAQMPGQLTSPRTALIPADRVVWLTWEVPSYRLQIAPERSAMERIRPGSSAFGATLWSPETIERDRRARP